MNEYAPFVRFAVLFEVFVEGRRIVVERNVRYLDVHLKQVVALVNERLHDWYQKGVVLLVVLKKREIRLELFADCLIERRIRFFDAAYSRSNGCT